MTHPLIVEFARLSAFVVPVVLSVGLVFGLVWRWWEGRP